MTSARSAVFTTASSSLMPTVTRLPLDFPNDLSQEDLIGKPDLSLLNLKPANTAASTISSRAKSSSKDTGLKKMNSLRTVSAHAPVYSMSVQIPVATKEGLGAPKWATRQLRFDGYLLVCLEPEKSLPPPNTILDRPLLPFRREQSYGWPSLDVVIPQLDSPLIATPVSKFNYLAGGMEPVKYFNRTTWTLDIRQVTGIEVLESLHPTSPTPANSFNQQDATLLRLWKKIKSSTRERCLVLKTKGGARILLAKNVSELSRLVYVLTNAWAMHSSTAKSTTDPINCYDPSQSFVVSAFAAETATVKYAKKPSEDAPKTITGGGGGGLKGKKIALKEVFDSVPFPNSIKSQETSRPNSRTSSRPLSVFANSDADVEEEDAEVEHNKQGKKGVETPKKLVHASTFGPDSTDFDEHVYRAMNDPSYAQDFCDLEGDESDQSSIGVRRRLPFAQKSLELLRSLASPSLAKDSSNKGVVTRGATIRRRRLALTRKSGGGSGRAGGGRKGRVKEEDIVGILFMDGMDEEALKSGQARVKRVPSNKGTVAIVTPTGPGEQATMRGFKRWRERAKEEIETTANIALREEFPISHYSELSTQELQALSSPRYPSHSFTNLPMTASPPPLPPPPLKTGEEGGRLRPVSMIETRKGDFAMPPMMFDETRSIGSNDNNKQQQPHHHHHQQQQQQQQKGGGGWRNFFHKRRSTSAAELMEQHK